MDFEVAKSKIINYIGISKKTEYEVRNKLKLMNVGQNEVLKIISYLKQAGYINDKDYTDAYMRQCMRLLKFSVYEIKQKLLQKGIKKDIIETALQNIDIQSYEDELVEKIKRSKLKVMDEKKLCQYLYRRGLKNCIYEE
ncbi:MAG: RecX family transcriptional regulator [Clostridia bacterium]|nr:RecX family transcriptional regulator [Clostridia bacterium]